MKASFPDIYLPSLSSAGKTWRIGYFKPEGRPGIVVATEGESEVSEGIRIFKCVLFDDCRIRRQLPGRATKRAIAQALASLVTEMRDAGRIPLDRANALILSL